ncbi:DUF3604 domain-containing protein, partial [Pseudoalteromonas sp.]|uniref:DUF3604 domain-containing protein n=1 Tax=Pseudoalteromonas sp. TaxID=53249 RepID=UPI0030035C26
KWIQLATLGNKVMAFKKTLLSLAILSTSTSIALASSEGPSEEAKKYSPPANVEHATNVYWGDSHLHTGLSLDAGLFGNTLGPDDAYRLPLTAYRLPLTA